MSASYWQTKIFYYMYYNNLILYTQIGFCKVTEITFTVTGLYIGVFYGFGIIGGAHVIIEGCYPLCRFYL